MEPPPAPAVDVDARRLLCPLPLLRAEKAMAALRPGEVLRLRATDPGLQRDLPAWCAVNGHHLLSLEQQDGLWIGTVRKGDPPP